VSAAYDGTIQGLSNLQLHNVTDNFFSYINSEIPIRIIHSFYLSDCFLLQGVPNFKISSKLKAIIISWKRYMVAYF